MSDLPEDRSRTYIQLGIQFIQIGSDSQARVFLEKLDNDLKEKHSIRVRVIQSAVFASRLTTRAFQDMVDTEPYNPTEVTGARLAKLLLGGINRKIDRST